MKEARLLNLGKNKNIWFGICTIFFSLFIYFNLSTLGKEAAFFPKILAISLFVVGLVIIFKEILDELKPNKKDKYNLKIGEQENNEEGTLTKNLLILFILILGFLLIETFGFYFMLLIVWLFIHLLIRKEFGIKSIVSGFLLGIIITTILIIIFKFGLGLHTPKGMII